ncbi:hypothetical protein D9M71_423230 [compost metagenome]
MSVICNMEYFQGFTGQENQSRSCLLLAMRIKQFIRALVLLLWDLMSLMLSSMAQISSILISKITIDLLSG